MKQKFNLLLTPKIATTFFFWMALFVLALAQKPLKTIKVRGTLMPMFQLVKETKFPVTELPKSLYNFSRAELVKLPAGFAGAKKPQNIAYITYGWKKGGLVRLYETPSIKGVKANKMLGHIMDAGIFHDSYRDPRFVSDAVTVKGVDIVVTSLDPKILKNAIENLRP